MAVQSMDETVARPRILFFAHDGRGLGHLRRLSRIAEKLQHTCSVLFVTGHREAGWIVPESAEFLHLPSWESIHPFFSAQWNRTPLFDEDWQRGSRLRYGLLRTAFRRFRPHAVVVDHLPFGSKDELGKVLDEAQVPHKYLVLRGVLDTRQRTGASILTPSNQQALERDFQKVFVACDPRIIDLSEEYDLSEGLRHKLVYVGYVAAPCSPFGVLRTRVERGLRPGDRWVVCSAGGGKESEALTESCINLAKNSSLFFDVVIGPRSRLRWRGMHLHENRIRITKREMSLPQLHASADVVISAGGYNSLTEAYSGRANVICVPIPGDYEQMQNASRLGSYMSLELVTELHHLPAALSRALSRQPVRHLLSLSGADRIAEAIWHDVRKMPD